jgi:hypothetical protein
MKQGREKRIVLLRVTSLDLCDRVQTATKKTDHCSKLLTCLMTLSILPTRLNSLHVLFAASVPRMHLTTPSTIWLVPESTCMPTSTPIVCTRLPRVLWASGRVDRGICRTSRGLAASLAATGVTLEASAASTRAAGGLRHLFIHAVPRGRAALAAKAGLLLHAALLLLFVFLLFESELVLRGVSGSWCLRGRAVSNTLLRIEASSGALRARAAATTHHGLHGHWVHAAGSAHHILRIRGPSVAVHAAAHHLRLHLLHLHWVHAAHGSHGAGHATAAGLLLSEILLHLLEILLHALPVLSHHGRGHGTVGTLLRGVLLVIVASVTIISVVTVVELVVAAELLVAAIVVAHVATWLGTLDLDRLTQNLQRLS